MKLGNKPIGIQKAILLLCGNEPATIYLTKVAWNKWSLMAENLGQMLKIPNAWFEENILKALSNHEIPTCCVWRPAASSAQPCAAPRRLAEEQSRAPGVHPLCSPDTWLSHMTRSRTPSPTEGDKLSKNTLSCWTLGERGNFFLFLLH